MVLASAPTGAAPAEVLFDRLRRDEHRDVLDALAAPGRPTRDEIQLLREQLRREAAAHTAPAPAPVPPPVPPATIAPGDTAGDDTVPMEELFTTLTAAAAISVVEVACPAPP